MKPAEIVARLAQAGFRFTSDDGQPPKLIGPRGREPGDVMPALAANREAVLRFVLCRDLLARAGERKVWGLVSGEPEILPLKGRSVPDSWDYLCFEGSIWVELPKIPKAG